MVGRGCGWASLALFAVLGCAPERPSPSPSRDGAVPRIAVGLFRGEVNAVTGAVTIEPLPSGASRAALLVDVPGPYAELTVVADGVPFRGPAETVELRTIRSATVSNGCGAIPSFEGEVQLNSFLGQHALHRPHAEILRITPTGRESCASVVPPWAGVSSGNGLFAWTDVEPGGSAVGRWVFALPDSSSFTFVGRVIAELVERVPPVTTPSPPPGYHGPGSVSVTLTCADAGSGCAATYYAIGAAGPRRLYAGPLLVASGTQLCFHSVDRADNAERPRCVTYEVDGLTAVYDPVRKVPTCSQVGSSCDTGSVLVYGRGSMSGWSEQNRPNTLDGGCVDGNAGTLAVDESLDRLRVSSTDGGPLRAGRPVKIEATVWAGAAYTSDALDLYFAPDAASPLWTLVGTLVPRSSGGQVLSTTWTLPASAPRPVLRGAFRYGGSAGPCPVGSYNDRDDLVFAVASAGAADTTPPAVAITSLAGDALVSGAATISITATDAVGVAAVELFANGRRVGVDATAPYQIPWDAHAFAGRAVQLRAVAWDAAGNRGVSAPVTVRVDDGSCATACPGGALCRAGACLPAPCSRTLSMPAPPMLAGRRYDQLGASRAADLNGDGKVDLVLANGNSGVAVALGNGDGTFAPLVTYAALHSPADVAVGDVTRDGRSDLVVAGGVATGVSILPGNGDGTFGAATSLPMTGSTYGVALADFNGDGRLDVAAAEDSYGVGVRLNGVSAFAPETRYSVAYAKGIVAADLDRNGRPDLVVGSRSAAALLVNDGAGRFVAGSWLFGAEPWDGYVTAGDLDGDGAPDVAISQQYSVTVYYNDGAGGFDPMAPHVLSYDALADLRGLAVADVDADGLPDLLAADWRAAEGAWLTRGLGAGAFAPPEPVRFGGQLQLTAADLTGDGRPDLVGVGGTGVSGQFASIALNAGGGFPSFASTAIGVASRGVAVADLDRDGRPDLLVVGSDSSYPYNGVDALLADAQGGFGAPLRWDSGAPGLVAIDAGDVNGDGAPDAVVLDATAKTFTLLANDGAGLLAPAGSWSVQPGATAAPVGIALGDLDGDGRADVVVANRTTNQLLVFWNDGAGGFGAPAVLATGAVSVAGVALGDVNGDGALDLVVADAGSQLEVLLGASGRSFASPFTLATGNNTAAVVVADLNGDGLADLAALTAGVCRTAVSVLLQTAPGTFAAAVERDLQFAYVTAVLRAVDLDGDGDLDLVVKGDGTVIALRNDGTGTLSAPAFYASGYGTGALAVLEGGEAGRPRVITAQSLRNEVHVHPITCGP